MNFRRRLLIYTTILTLSASAIPTHKHQEPEVSRENVMYNHGIQEVYKFGSPVPDQRREKLSARDEILGAFEFINLYFLKPINCFWNIASDGEGMDHDLKRLEGLNKASMELIDEVQYYVAYAGAAYCKSESLSDCSYCRHINGKIEKVLDEPTNTKAIVVYNKDKSEIVVAFRGSEGFSKFVKAAAVVNTTFLGINGAFVHTNHMFFVSQIHLKLCKKINALTAMNSANRLVILGQSLGGSLATLAAPNLASCTNFHSEKVRIITYGQPRSGNTVFADWYNKQRYKFTRVVNFADPIVSHPPYIEGWAHVHNELFIAEDKQYYLCDTKEPENKLCSFGRATWLGLINSHKYVGDTVLSSRQC